MFQCLWIINMILNRIRISFRLVSLDKHIYWNVIRESLLEVWLSCLDMLSTEICYSHCLYCGCWNCWRLACWLLICRFFLQFWFILVFLILLFRILWIIKIQITILQEKVISRLQFWNIISNLLEIILTRLWLLFWNIILIILFLRWWV